MLTEPLDGDLADTPAGWECPWQLRLFRCIEEVEQGGHSSYL
jgi:hypothetical protein